MSSVLIGLVECSYFNGGQCPCVCKNRGEHDEHLEEVLKLLVSAGVTLNA